ncbi:hypothetical protein ACH5RR_032340 [Cinchona calisaya]|uniref:Retrotransposon gag domain-containing protein n=1 Tax=Cinchona calisaya TaxID=153742 RepID=A0ABD2YN34_9GENT
MESELNRQTQIVISQEGAPRQETGTSQTQAEESVGIDQGARGQIETESQTQQIQQLQQSQPSQTPVPVIDYATIAAIVGQAVHAALHTNHMTPASNPQPQPEAKDVDYYYRAITKIHIPTFEGRHDPDEAERWLGQIEENLELLKVPDEYRVPIVKPYLVGDASRWWKGVRPVFAPTGQIAWIVFKKAFLEHFYPSHLRIERRDEFNSFRQTPGMSVVEYSHRFHALGMFAPGVMSDRVEKCDRFKRGLLKDIRDRIAAVDTDTFEKLYDASARVDTYLRRQAAEERDDRGLYIPPQRTIYRPVVPPVRSVRPPQPSFSQFRGFRPQPPQVRPRPPLAIAGPSRVIDKRGGTVSAPVLLQARPRIPECSYCHRYHVGECRWRSGACLACGSFEHRIRDCPTARPGPSQRQMSQGRSGNSTGPPTARVYALTQQEVDRSGQVVTVEDQQETLVGPESSADQGGDYSTDPSYWG